MNGKVSVSAMHLLFIAGNCCNLSTPYCHACNVQCDGILGHRNGSLCGVSAGDGDGGGGGEMHSACDNHCGIAT